MATARPKPEPQFHGFRRPRSPDRAAGGEDSWPARGRGLLFAGMAGERRVPQPVGHGCGDVEPGSTLAVDLVFTAPLRAARPAFAFRILYSLLAENFFCDESAHSARHLLARYLTARCLPVMNRSSQKIPAEDFHTTKKSVLVCTTGPAFSHVVKIFRRDG